MKALAVCTLLVLAAVACLPPAGAIFKTTAVQPDGSYPMGVMLGDQTGLVTAIDSAEGDPLGSVAEPNVRPDPDDANAVILTFFTGACDDETVVSLLRSRAGFDLRVEVRGGLVLGGCTAQLVIRSVRIRFSEPVAAGSIVAVGGR